MNLSKYLHGPQEDLPKTLASRISFIRNARRIHIQELAHQARVSIKLLEDIEAGIETWLPTAIRQRIARVLRVDPNILKEVETHSHVSFTGDILKDPPRELVERIQEEILSNKKDIKCPVCQNPLKVWIQEGLDLNGLLVKSAKGHCTSCIFQIKS
ncbi:MAG: helix-turn-helix transcriptional regulator [Candidatus Melainabacteria bacterium]|nr:helix-turn-helix transcriptional regulator [Candidatus Melainabacteria bacterium]